MGTLGRTWVGLQDALVRLEAGEQDLVAALAHPLGEPGAQRRFPHLTDGGEDRLAVQWLGKSGGSSSLARICTGRNRCG